MASAASPGPGGAIATFEAKRAEMRQFLDQAAEARAAGDWEMAVHLTNDAELAERIADALEYADGNACSFPTDGRVAA